MKNYSLLKRSELIELLAINTVVYLATSESESNSLIYCQSKEVIDEVVIEFARRRFDFPVDWNHPLQDSRNN